MEANLQHSVDFLEWFRPGGPWTLSAIVPGGRITTNTFRTDQKSQLLEWLELHVGRENIYFQVNYSGDVNLTKKANKKDITEAHWFHVDIDPSSDPALHQAERARILEKLQKSVPPPSLIIDSGGGYQGFWRLSAPVKPDDGDWSEFERYNRQIEADLGGDHCHNVDRIMRLPGTINVPNKKKRSAGRVEALSLVVSQNDTTFDLDTFSQAPLLDGGEKGDVGRPKVELSGNLPKLDSPDDLDPYKVDDYTKMLIVQGTDPDNPQKWESRSECFFHVVCELNRCEVPDDIIAAVILDPDFPISGHCLDQKNPQGYAVRQIQRAKESNEENGGSDLVVMNDEFFCTVVGGKFRVGRMDNKSNIDFMDKTTLMDLFANQRVLVGQSKDGLPISKPKGKWWLEHPQRRQYLGGVVFDPAGDVAPDAYNLWRGFSVPAVAGDKHEPYLEHILNNICGGNKEYYDYIIGWMARLVQFPATQSETAIVLRGKEGTGKNTFVGAIGDLFPQHYFESSASSQFLGNFNSHLRDKILVHANEAFFAGDKKHEATLKHMITEPMIAIEAKGVDITRQPNYLHVVMSSNSEWVVPAGPEARRFMVMDVDDARMGDGKYFGHIKQQLADGGLSNLLRFLLDYDLTGFEVRKVPVTKGLVDQRLRTMDSSTMWWLTCLERGYIINRSDGWIRQLPTDHVVKAYQNYCQDSREMRPKAPPILGQWLKTQGIEKKRLQVQNTKQYVYHFGDIEELRQDFDALHGGPFEWGSLDADVQGDIPF